MNTEGMYTQTKHEEQTTGGNDQRGNQRSCDHIRKVARQQGHYRVWEGQRGRMKVYVKLYINRVCDLYSKLICASSYYTYVHKENKRQN